MKALACWRQGTACGRPRFQRATRRSTDAQSMGDPPELCSRRSRAQGGRAHADPRWLAGSSYTHRCVECHPRHEQSSAAPSELLPTRIKRRPANCRQRKANGFPCPGVGTGPRLELFLKSYRAWKPWRVVGQGRRAARRSRRAMRRAADAQSMAEPPELCMRRSRAQGGRAHAGPGCPAGGFSHQCVVILPKHGHTSATPSESLLPSEENRPAMAYNGKPTAFRALARAPARALSFS